MSIAAASSKCINDDALKPQKKIPQIRISIPAIIYKIIFIYGGLFKS